MKPHIGTLGSGFDRHLRIPPRARRSAHTPSRVARVRRDTRSGRAMTDDPNGSSVTRVGQTVAVQAVAFDLATTA